MAVNIGNTPLKAAYLGAAPLEAIYMGSTQLWPGFSGPVVHDFLKPGTFYLDIPPGVGYVAVSLTGGGRAGERGSSTIGTPGKGGSAGKGAYALKLTAEYDLPIEITVGAGGEPSDRGNSPTAEGKPSKVVLSGSASEPYEKSVDGGSNIMTGQDGQSVGWSNSAENYARGLQATLAETHPGGPFHVSDTGLWNGPGGTGNGGSGTRGGGGAGGNGGTFGRHSLGGAGGDGAVRIVFWKDEEEMNNFTA